jgi:hypothetical protein
MPIQRAPERLSQRRVRELVAALAGLPAPPHHDAPLERIARDALPVLQGTYRAARQGALELRVEGGHVRLPCPGATSGSGSPPVDW